MPPRTIRFDYDFIIPRLPELTGPDLKLLNCLASRRNAKTGLCCPSYDMIRIDTGLRRQAISDAIKHLIELGMLERIHEGSVGAGRKFNKYQILDGFKCK